MKTLVCGFKGTDNTAKLLLDKLNIENKLYLDNDFETSVEQVSNELKKENYDFILLMGQKPVIKSLYIETTGRKDRETLITKCNYLTIKEYFDKLNYKTKISDNAGNYLCNNIYYHCLKNIKENSLETLCIFFHIPTINHVFDLDKSAKDISSMIHNNISS